MKRWLIIAGLVGLILSCSDAPVVKFEPSPRIVLAELFTSEG